VLHFTIELVPFNSFLKKLFFFFFSLFFIIIIRLTFYSPNEAIANDQKNFVSEFE